MPILFVLTALLGLAVGSFLNVVIHRVPAGESVVSPASACPACGHQIRARHNVPVLGWLLLRGRCADCAEPISVRYPLVELATAVLFVAVTWNAARLDLLPALPAFLVFVAAGVALTAIDLDVMRLPNAIVYPTFGLVAAGFVAASVVTGEVQPLVRAAVAAAALGLLFLALALAKPGGMGLGDVKLAVVIGAVLGYVSYPSVVVGVFAAFLLGTLAGAVLVVVRRAGRGSLLPFGPALVAGAVLALFVGGPISDAYLTLTQIA
ncbi:prepilin peptidase [Solicola sp. PLA-1-18]|uniref:prepilin peptidase n=1 Tax=Solicola sp. PLA-1-18 TaxID=3380532 RepID=UPI003B79DFB1